MRDRLRSPAGGSPGNGRYPRRHRRMKAVRLRSYTAAQYGEVRLHPGSSSVTGPGPTGRHSLAPQPGLIARLRCTQVEPQQAVDAGWLTADTRGGRPPVCGRSPPAAPDSPHAPTGATELRCVRMPTAGRARLLGSEPGASGVPSFLSLGFPPRPSRPGGLASGPEKETRAAAGSERGRPRGVVVDRGRWAGGATVRWRWMCTRGAVLDLLSPGGPAGFGRILLLLADWLVGDKHCVKRSGQLWR